MKKFFLPMILFVALPLVLFAQGDEPFFKVRRAQRRIEAHTIKSGVAHFNEKKSVRRQLRNGDLERYLDLRGSYGKALNHLSTGFVQRNAFQSLLIALQSESISAFNQIILGEGIVKLINPQASLVFSLAGNDGWIHTMPAAPAFASQESGAEMVELYWTALVRDVPFNEFSTNATVANAIAELNTLTDFTGPKIGGQVTPQTFLRGNAPGNLVGPYISQFLYQTIPYGSTTIAPEQTVPAAGTLNDFNTMFTDWFTVINGGSTGNTITYDPSSIFLRTPRDLSEYVHQDTPGQEVLNSLLILHSYGPSALDPNSYYLNNPTQEGFVTFGLADALFLARAAAEEALKAAWYQKWQVHLRLRPEEYGFNVQQQIVNGLPLGIPSQLINSQALQEIFATFGSYFLPQAYPEGSPTHPSYPAGHAAFIGAGVTILKALFNENFVIPNPLQPDAANTALEAYPGILTVGGELNKLASNIALGRDHAGVHYRSDGTEGILLGEKIAIDVLNNQSFLFNEDFVGYTLTKFDGTTILVGGKRAP